MIVRHNTSMDSKGFRIFMAVALTLMTVLIVLMLIETLADQASSLIG